MFFSFTTKNLNWEILTENLVSFKRWIEIKDKKFQCWGCLLKSSILTGVPKNLYIGGNCLKRGGLGQFADLRRKGGGPRQKRGGGVFEGGLIPQCTL